MLHITVIAVGKLKECFWSAACEEYLKRLKPYAQVQVLEVADVDPAKVGGDAQARAREGSAILGAIDAAAPVQAQARVVLLDVQGKQLSSEQFAEQLQDYMLTGANDVVFVIGGSTGVSADVQKRADVKLSFGAITLPHNLARVVLLEQVYRAFKIIKGEPYHK